MTRRAGWAERIRRSLLAILLPFALAGCHAIPVSGDIRADATANVAGNLNGKFEVKIPQMADPGPMVPAIVRASPNGPEAPRVAVIDLDGLIVNQNLTGAFSVGENPVAAFREKLEASARDPRIHAVVLRVNSPGGGVAACDTLAEELRRFRVATRKPVVACLLDLATGGAYYVAVGSDVVVAQPTTVTGAIGALINHYNLEDAMAQWNVRIDSVKSGDLVDMGTVTKPLPDEVRGLLKEISDDYRNRFFVRVSRNRPAMTDADRRAVADGRIVAASRALNLHMVDRLGYLDDAIAEAERLAGTCGAEVVMLHREGNPLHSVYAITPNTPLQSEIIPFSYPGLDRNKLPTFLYLWQPDPTIVKVPGR